MPTSLLDAPTDTTAPGLLEWIESTILLEDLDGLSRAEILHRLAGVGGGDETEVGLVFSEVRRRRAVAPELYPFNVDDELIVRDRNVDHAIYEALLLMSLQEADFRQRRRFEIGGLILDRLGRDALLSYLGFGARAVRFAWPPRGERPADFKQGLAWLAAHLGLPTGQGPWNPQRKDGASTSLHGSHSPTACQSSSLCWLSAPFSSTSRAKLEMSSRSPGCIGSCSAGRRTRP